MRGPTRRSCEAAILLSVLCTVSDPSPYYVADPSPLLETWSFVFVFGAYARSPVVIVLYLVLSDSPNSQLSAYVYLLSTSLGSRTFAPSSHIP